MTGLLAGLAWSTVTVTRIMLLTTALITVATLHLALQINVNFIIFFAYGKVFQRLKELLMPIIDIKGINVQGNQHLILGNIENELAICLGAKTGD